MKDRKLATRYARALLSALPDDAARERTDTFLSAVREAYEDSPEFRDLLLDPAIPREGRSQVLVRLAQERGVPHQVVNFLRTVVDHNRAGSLPSMAVVFHEEREAAAGIVPAEITTAQPLTPDLEARARQALERATGQKVRLTAVTDPDLIGGAVTRLGSYVYDGSLRTQLNRLRDKMTQE